MKTCTTDKQSLNLMKLGLKLKTADYTINITYGDPICKRKIGLWSLQTLLTLIPKHEHPSLEAYIDSKTQKQIWQCSCIHKDSKFKKNPLDAVYEVVCYLLKRKFM